MAEEAVATTEPERLWIITPARYVRVAGWIALALIAAQAVKGRAALPNPGTALEAACHVVLFCLLLSFTPFVRWMSSIPSSHRAIVTWFFFCVMVGQLAYDNRRTFPFPAWMMYGKQEVRERLEYYRYRGIDAQGREVNVDPAKVLKFANVAEIASHVRYIARDARLPEGHPKSAINRKRLHDLLVTVATGYNQQHPDAPLRSLTFLWYSWDFRHDPPDAVTPEPMLTIDLPEGGAR